MIPSNLKEIIDYVIEYVDNTTNDWFKIKRELANNFPPKDRKRFSRRHYSTKKHSLNEFDRLVIEYWEIKTGSSLFIDTNKLHPQNWVQKPRGWGLSHWNEKQKRNKETSADD